MFGLLLRAITALVAVILLLGFAGRIHPFFDSIGHFRLQITIVLILQLVTLIFMQQWKTIAAMTVLTVYSGFSMGFPTFSETNEPASGPAFRIVQFNSLFKNAAPEKSADWIRSQSPDIVTMQEVSKRNGTIMSSLKAELPYQVLCEFASVGGVAILSRHPISTSKCVSGQGLVWAQVNVYGKELSVASLHLHWPYPYRQMQHIERLKPELADMQQPVVLGGDFNAAPWSKAVQQVADATNTTVVPGLRLTLRMVLGSMQPIPFMPVDHVLLPKDWRIIRAARGPDLGSDHHPVVVDFQLRSFPLSKDGQVTSP